MIGKLKNYLIAGLSVLAGVLALILSIYGRIAGKRKRENKTLKANIEKRQEVAERDNEIEEQTRSRRADLANEVNNTGEHSVFADANKLRRKPRD